MIVLLFLHRFCADETYERCFATTFEDEMVSDVVQTWIEYEIIQKSVYDVMRSHLAHINFIKSGNEDRKVVRNLVYFIFQYQRYIFAIHFGIEIDLKNTKHQKNMKRIADNLMNHLIFYKQFHLSAREDWYVDIFSSNKEFFLSYVKSCTDFYFKSFFTDKNSPIYYRKVFFEKMKMFPKLVDGAKECSSDDRLPINENTSAKGNKGKRKMSLITNIPFQVAFETFGTINPRKIYELFLNSRKEIFDEWAQGKINEISNLNIEIYEIQPNLELFEIDIVNLTFGVIWGESFASMITESASKKILNSLFVHMADSFNVDQNPEGNIKNIEDLQLNSSVGEGCGVLKKSLCLKKNENVNPNSSLGEGSGVFKKSLCLKKNEDVNPNSRVGEGCGIFKKSLCLKKNDDVNPNSRSGEGSGVLKNSLCFIKNEDVNPNSRLGEGSGVLKKIDFSSLNKQKGRKSIKTIESRKLTNSFESTKEDSQNKLKNTVEIRNIYNHPNFHKDGDITIFSVSNKVFYKINASDTTGNISDFYGNIEDLQIALIMAQYPNSSFTRKNVQCFSVDNFVKLLIETQINCFNLSLISRFENIFDFSKNCDNVKQCPHRISSRELEWDDYQQKFDTQLIVTESTVVLELVMILAVLTPDNLIEIIQKDNLTIEKLQKDVSRTNCILNENYEGVLKIAAQNPFKFLFLGLLKINKMLSKNFETVWDFADVICSEKYLPFYKFKNSFRYCRLDSLVRNRVEIAFFSYLLDNNFCTTANTEEINASSFEHELFGCVIAHFKQTLIKEMRCFCPSFIYDILSFENSHYMDNNLGTSTNINDLLDKTCLNYDPGLLNTSINKDNTDEISSVSPQNQTVKDNLNDNQLNRMYNEKAAKMCGLERSELENHLSMHYEAIAQNKLASKRLLEVPNETEKNYQNLTPAISEKKSEPKQKNSINEDLSREKQNDNLRKEKYRHKRGLMGVHSLEKPRELNEKSSKSCPEIARSSCERSLDQDINFLLSFIEGDKTDNITKRKKRKNKGDKAKKEIDEDIEKEIQKEIEKDIKKVANNNDIEIKNSTVSSEKEICKDTSYTLNNFKSEKYKKNVCESKPAKLGGVNEPNQGIIESKYTKDRIEGSIKPEKVREDIECENDIIESKSLKDKKEGSIEPESRIKVIKSNKGIVKSKSQKVKIEGFIEPEKVREDIECKNDIIESKSLKDKKEGSIEPESKIKVIKSNKGIVKSKSQKDKIEGFIEPEKVREDIECKNDIIESKSLKDKLEDSIKPESKTKVIESNKSIIESKDRKDIFKGSVKPKSKTKVIKSNKGIVESKNQKDKIEGFIEPESKTKVIKSNKGIVKSKDRNDRIEGFIKPGKASSVTDHEKDTIKSTNSKFISKKDLRSSCEPEKKYKSIGCENNYPEAQPEYLDGITESFTFNKEQCAQNHTSTFVPCQRKQFIPTDDSQMNASSLLGGYSPSGNLFSTSGGSLSGTFSFINADNFELKTEKKGNEKIKTTEITSEHHKIENGGSKFHVDNENYLDNSQSIKNDDNLIHLNNLDNKFLSSQIKGNVNPFIVSNFEFQSSSHLTEKKPSAYFLNKKKKQCKNIEMKEINKNELEIIKKQTENQEKTKNDLKIKNDSSIFVKKDTKVVKKCDPIIIEEKKLISISEEKSNSIIKIKENNHNFKTNQVYTKKQNSNIQSGFINENKPELNTQLGSINQNTYSSFTNIHTQETNTHLTHSNSHTGFSNIHTQESNTDLTHSNSHTGFSNIHTQESNTHLSHSNTNSGFLNIHAQESNKNLSHSYTNSQESIIQQQSNINQHNYNFNQLGSSQIQDQNINTLTTNLYQNYDVLITPTMFYKNSLDPNSNSLYVLQKALFFNQLSQQYHAKDIFVEYIPVENRINNRF